MVRLEEISSRELSLVIDSGATTVVVPFGSVEYHGGHLPLGSDSILADVVGELVAERLDAVLAPTVRVGCADAHMDRMGTLSVPAETLCTVAYHIACSLFAHGFRVIALVSTHGGNQAALEDAARLLTEENAKLVACAPRGDVGPAPGSYSGVWLTSAMLAVRPDLVDLESAPLELKDEVRRAAPESGAENLERFVAAIVRTVRDAAQRRPS
jgi:creatinine amidohydrolase/Fe(II)-dependent formamide hydrolase-like protein